jgi:hypothetical protein
MSAVNTVLIQKLMSQQKDKTLIDQTKLVDTANLALALFKERVKAYVHSLDHGKIDEEMERAQQEARSAVYQYNTSPAFTSSLPAPVGPPGSQFAIEDIDEVAPPKSKRAKKDKTDIKNRGVTYTAHNHFVASYMPIVKAATVIVDGIEKKQFDNHAAMAELGRLWRIIQPDTKMQFHLEAKGIKIHHTDAKPGIIDTLGAIASDKDVNKALNSRYVKLDLDQKRAYYIRGNMLEGSAEFDLVSQHLHADYASLKYSIEVVPHADPHPTAGDMPVVQGTTMVQGTVSSSS